MKKYLTLLAFLLPFAAASAQSINTHLQACFPADGDFLDASGKGVVAAGTATYAADRHGTPNACVFLNGTSHFVIDTLAKILPTNEWTISFWSKTTQINNNIPFFTIPDNSSDRLATPIHYSAGVPSRLIFDYGDIGGTGRNSMDMSFDTMWHHYAFIISQSTAKKQVYIDGHLFMNVPLLSVIINKNQNVAIGGGYDPAMVNNFYHGYMDDIKIYDLAFDSVQVHTAMTTTTCLVTGVEEISATSLKIYPSPSSGLLHIDIPFLQEAVKLEVLNMNGELLQVKEVNNDNHSVELVLNESLPNGAYMLHLHSEKQEIKRAMFMLQR